MKPRSSNLRIRLAGVCLVAMFATFLPAAAAFWDTAVPTADVASNRAPSGTSGRRPNLYRCNDRAAIDSY